ncbi:unnamed protein product [Taenia asiatica]|uniref:Dynactin subunit 2 n=1 Tax=Taenia asiatica TaxID=60517 RepID=A0A0R3VX35_TAEAS|nr:unnamed protein product [Taenia asiatica]
MEDPYILPCGHSFCLRPCLLSQDGALTARCIKCDMEFDAAKLQPNHKAALKICLSSLQREQEKELEQEKEQQKQEQQVENEGEIRGQTSTNAKETLMMHLEKLKASITSELNPEKYTKDGIVGGLESTVMELQATVGKALDATIARLQTDSYESIEALAQQIADLSLEVAKFKDIYSSLEMTTVPREAQANPTSKVKPPCEVAPTGEDATKPQPLPETQMEASDQVVNVSLLFCDSITLLSLKLNAPVTAIEMTLTRTFETNILRVEASALNVQRNLENLSVDIGKAQKILLTMPNKLALLDDEKTQIKELLRIFNELQSAKNTMQMAQQALVDFNIEKYILSSEALTLIKRALDNFEFVVQGEDADSKDENCSQVKEPIDQVVT